MRTIEKTSKQASKQATTDKDTADLSIDLATYCKARKMAGAEGMQTEDWIEKLIQENTAAATKPKSSIIHPDGTVTLRGELCKEAQASADARGITLSEYVSLALRHGLALRMEQPLFEQSIHDGKLPVYLEADTVKFLREVCEAGTITAEDFTDAIIGDMVKSYLDGHDSAGDFILDLWIIADRPAAEKAMQAVADRWKAKQAAKA